MSNYAKLKKLDEVSLQKLKEGEGPADQCLCTLLSTEEKKSVAASVKKAFKAFGIKKSKKEGAAIDISKNGFNSKLEVLKHKKSCGKCVCNKEKLVLKHSYANIRITSPDVSSICPCPTDCLPDKEKLQNNIKVIVEHANVHTTLKNDDD
ncbi:uncharacterized protein LOC123666937 [Melitaea cinxia]|uniref:uncharacterized protein LOC123666937 n=1 Tax=Melitaea cinxia TaxID=113334 RepID=UPI001E274AAA|nr:uncharacterized protein LOC123666937 [Melitaea cinxia]